MSGNSHVEDAQAPMEDPPEPEEPEAVQTADEETSESTKSFLINLNLGETVYGMDILSSDVDAKPDDDAGAPSEVGSSKNKGKPKQKANVKKAVVRRLKVCPICSRETDDWGKRPYCRLCNNDWEASERDAKTNGEMAYWKEVSKDMSTMKSFLIAWKQECGPSRGAGHKRGGFKFAKFRQERQREISNFAGQERIQLTEREFIAHFEKKGMSQAWGQQEFNRRRSDKRWHSDNDPDCNLPRVQAHGQTLEISGTKDSLLEATSFHTAGVKNPNQKHFKELIDGFGSETAADSAIAALRSGDDAALFAKDVGPGPSTYGAKDFLAAQLLGGGAQSPANPSAASSGSGGAGAAAPSDLLLPGGDLVLNFIINLSLSFMAWVGGGSALI